MAIKKIRAIIKKAQTPPPVAPKIPTIPIAPKAPEPWVPVTGVTSGFPEPNSPVANCWSPAAPVAPPKTSSATLYFPGIGRSIPVNRKEFTVGIGHRYDLDLTSLPNLSRRENIHLSFQRRKEGWMVCDLSRGATALLNNQAIEAEGSPLKEGDYLLLAQREVIIITGLTIEQSEEPSLPLNRQIHLYSESISMVRGHAGSDVIFYPDSRKVIYKRWSIHDGGPTNLDEDFVDIPADIVTKDQMKAYVRMHRHWPVDMNDSPHGIAVPCPDTESILYFDRDLLLRYSPATNTLTCQQWAADQYGVDAPFTCDTLQTPYRMSKLTLLIHMMMEKPEWPNPWQNMNRDMVLESDHEGDVLYCAERREITLIPSDLDGHIQVLHLPENVCTLPEVAWYICIHEPNWIWNCYWDREMLQDHDFSQNSFFHFHPGESVHYIAKRRAVVHKKKGVEVAVLPVPLQISGQFQMTQYAMKQWPDLLRFEFRL